MPTMQAAASLGLLLIAPLNSSLILQQPCLSQNFYGHYRDDDTTSSFFRLETPDCIQVFSNSYLSQEPSTLLATPSSDKRLVWIERAAVDESLLGDTDHDFPLTDVLSRLRTRDAEEAQQPLFSSDSLASTMLHRFNTSILIALPSEEAFGIHNHLPRFWKSTIIPDTPSSYRVVSDENVERVRRVLSTLELDPRVASVVDSISTPQIESDLRFLTGEDDKSGIVSRASSSSGAITASNWIKEQIEATGAECRLETFRNGYAPNVIWCDFFNPRFLRFRLTCLGCPTAVMHRSQIPKRRLY